MYCPKCGTFNSETARFCRGCGSDISRVSQALTNPYPPEDLAGPNAADLPGRRRRQRQEPANLYKGISSVSVGIGFMLVAFSILFFAPAGRLWWFWLLIPAFGSLGKGIGEILRARHEQSRAGSSARELSPGSNLHQPLSPGSPAIVPPSVTEGTTRALESRAGDRRDSF